MSPHKSVINLYYVYNYIYNKPNSSGGDDGNGGGNNNSNSSMTIIVLSTVNSVGKYSIVP